MNIKTLEALQSFVQSVKHSLDADCDVNKEADALEELLEKEIKVAEALKAIEEGDDKFIFTDLPEFLKRQSS